MRLRTLLISTTFTLALITPAFAADTIKVSLWDKGGNMDLSKDMGMGLGTTSDMSKAPMGIRLSKKQVRAGMITFKVVNESKETLHEMLVAPLKDKNTLLPYIANENRVDEEKSGDLGEVSELEPGKSGELTLDLKPGLYILFCNVPGHFTAGMWTTVSVK
jgi:uncharacterized cupredoxin-like copper-binding protein